MENRRVILAVILSVAVLVAWQYFFVPPPTPPAADGAGQAPAAEATDGAEPAAEPAASGGEEAADAGDDTGSDVEAPPELVAPQPVEEDPVSADRERRVEVETDLYVATLSNRGARLVSFRLKEHEARGGEGTAVDLVRSRSEGPYPFSVVDPEGTPLSLDDALFAVTDSGPGRDRTLTFDYVGPEGSASKSFTFHDHGLFDAEVKVRRSEAASWRLFLGPGLRNPSRGEEESRFEKPAAVYAAGSEFQREDAAKAEQPIIVPGGGLRWVGLEDTYFLTAFIPRNDTLAEAGFFPYLQEGAAEGEEVVEHRFEPLPAELSDAEKELLREYALLLEPSPRGDNIELHAYWGAKKLSRLAALPYGLEQTVNLGWFGFLARWILKGLIWIHANLVANYGWSIVLMTLLIKLILLPLTHKSYVSMRKMQEINPQMQAIRAKWRGKLRDKNGKMNLEAQRQMNEEMQKLYREAGVNPVGGCLPMILQMPVLFAFYQLLYSAVELRGEPWILWIHDLSVKDPFLALPLIMGATQFLQMRMTPATGDPMQRRLMMFMPIVFTIFFLGFPSGLVLYWLTNNVLTIVQQGLYNQWKKQQENKASDKADDGSKKAGTRKGGKGSRRVAAK